MTGHHARIARLARTAVLMLGYAADDIERGFWSDAELHQLADGLDTLVSALRGNDQAGQGLLVINSERLDT
ncbi:hypothetical protein SAMN05421805_103270 [Saccharopolyspora antimicrobica]|uniref:Uncharacterized protein n=1 Tax=Saccharopolyspora antimicrobica TaxID=455193 RepID=A0A1I4X640_9PSEU|nr:hypothetical protein [Saccharopolyspora antimicrobica]RKT84343.1 hypothetical protein ATL45_2654 [Saccharopolyspora antimicrobica]SFN21441.1 hypothetical protein SAMN05421805_103270 [Saccharopolyspora antimicrobica]